MAKKRVKNIFGDVIGPLRGFSKRDQRILKRRAKRGKVTIF